MREKILQTTINVLEAMSAGVPVLTGKIGIEGITAGHTINGQRNRAIKLNGVFKMVTDESKAKRILVVSGLPCYPPITGNSRRIYNVIKRMKVHRKICASVSDRCQVFRCGGKKSEKIIGER